MKLLCGLETTICGPESVLQTPGARAWTHTQDVLWPCVTISAFDSPLASLPTHSSRICCHERVNWV